MESTVPPGEPRWVALFRPPSGESWRIAAESPYRTPVLYALAEMTRTRAGRPPLDIALWGPGDGAWHRYETALTAGPPPEEAAPEPQPGAGSGSASHKERMQDRRQQALLAGLGKAGLHELDDGDLDAVRELVDRLDETTVRRVAHWLALSGR